MSFKNGLSKVGGALRGIGGLPSDTSTQKEKVLDPKKKKNPFVRALGIAKGAGDGFRKYQNKD